MPEVLPTHLAYIMDGNRRYAKSRGLPILLGHRAGMNNIEPHVNSLAALRVPEVTFWAMSPENTKREGKQVADLLRLFQEGLNSDIVRRMIDSGVKLDVIGDMTFFDDKFVRQVDVIRDQSKNNNLINVNIALNYGGEEEMVAAVKAIIRAGHTEEEINKDLIRSYLFTRDHPDVDLVIRTGGAVRTSGFMPIKAAYAEWYFTPKYWPDFTPDDLHGALNNFSNRKRNFGV